MIRVPVSIEVDATKTEDLRKATDFDRAQAQDWEHAAWTGRKIGYEDEGILDIIEAFGLAIWNQSNTVLSEETEARISKFIHDPRLAAF